MMKDRSIRRHQEFIAKIKSRKSYNSCIRNLSPAEIEELGNNVQKLRKICVASHTEKEIKKPLREMKHDITMREQLRFS